MSEQKRLKADQIGDSLVKLDSDKIWFCVSIDKNGNGAWREAKTKTTWVWADSGVEVSFTKEDA